MGSSFFQDTPVDSTTGQSINDLVDAANAATAAAQAAQTAAETAQAAAEQALADAQAALASIPGTAEAPWKLNVRVATTASLDVSDAPAAIDGVALVPGDRILVKDQASPGENGIYDFVLADAALVRSADNNAANEFPNGTTVYVAEGNINRQRFFTQTTTGTIAPTSTKLYADIISASGNTAALPRPYDSIIPVAGALADNTTIVSVTYPRTFNIPANFAGSIAALGTAPTAPLVLDIQLDSTSIGSVTFGTGTTIGSFQAAVPNIDIAVGAGQNISVVTPASAQGAENLSITILGQVLV